MNDRYIASDGTSYDITSIHSERLINSLAKHHRDIYESNNIQEFEQHNNQIILIDAELLRREKEFYDKKIGGGLWT
jgi:hypothetical protein